MFRVKPLVAVGQYESYPMVAFRCGRNLQAAAVL